jgi:hypothetical protein
MSTELLGMVIALAGISLCVMMAVGFPALAVVAVKYFKLKEREMALELEYRQKSQQHDAALEQRVQRLEEVLTSLDHDVRANLAIGQSAAASPRLDSPD